jgi:hypothetical protein
MKSVLILSALSEDNSDLAKYLVGAALVMDFLVWEEDSSRPIYS